MGLDIVELFAAVEDAFAIHIPDERAVELTTVGALFAYLQQHSPLGRAPDAWERLVAVIAEDTGIAEERIRPEARFVYDLNLD